MSSSWLEEEAPKRLLFKYVLDVNSTVKGNPAELGIGGVLRDFKRRMLISFSKATSVGDANRVEGCSGVSGIGGALRDNGGYMKILGKFPNGLVHIPRSRNKFADHPEKARVD
ncbi:Uncharacterized protein TCM_036166 [Theobroma cacao]|uniref:Uncharacterized protein n=1 Tax=Theobroma cacao TaxID=3641 RepID=A0A061FK00_THECC|nr:Uncharacterized protein TCM_036166 [Theobroma cacao]